MLYLGFHRVEKPVSQNVFDEQLNCKLNLCLRFVFENLGADDQRLSDLQAEVHFDVDCDIIECFGFLRQTHLLVLPCCNVMEVVTERKPASKVFFDNQNLEG